jgi:hypothetical protein
VDSKSSSTYSVFALEVKAFRQSVNGQGNELHYWDYEGPNGEKARLNIDGTCEWK